MSKWSNADACRPSHGPQTFQQQPPPSAVSRWLLWLTSSALVLGAAFLFDGRVDAAAQVPTLGKLRTFARVLTVAGEWWSVGIVGLVSGLFFYFQGRFKTARAVLLVTLTGVATGLAAMFLRHIFGRKRPNAAVPQGFYGLWYHSHRIAGRYQFSSFVSGHAALVVGLATAAWRVNRRAGVWMGLFAVMVSWSRMAQSSHHFSDVIGATLLALWLAPQLQQRFREALRPRFRALEKSRLSYWRARPPRCRPAAAQFFM